MTRAGAPVRAIAPRIHAILAREARTAVVIRRGPSKAVAVIGWDRATDRFEVGQWLRGRIYERRCDLSPDGRHLVYFAMNGRWQSETLGSWTAVSRAPYVKALGLWPKGDCWNGGGLFVTNDSFWLNDGPLRHRTLYEAPGLSHRSDRPRSSGAYGGECPGVYYMRLQRDGWTLIDHAADGAGGSVAHFTKRVKDEWYLHKFAHETLARRAGRGCYFDEHSLVNEATSVVVACPDWEWAEVDGARLVWAADGKILAGSMSTDDLTGVTQLFDGVGMTFERLHAPY